MNRTTTTTTRLAAGLAALALPLGLAACGGMDDSGSDDTGTSAEATESEGEEGMDDSEEAAAPFGEGCDAVPDDGKGSFDGMAEDPVATAAGNNPALSTLTSAIGEAELASTLNSADDITVFAPTDDAFEAMDEATLDKAMDDPEGLLTTVLTHHVVEGRLAPEDVAGTHETMAGDEITVEGSDEDFTVDDDAKVVCGDVQTSNATVYIVDAVLMPDTE